jgi:hypothetical protein
MICSVVCRLFAMVRPPFPLRNRTNPNIQPAPILGDQVIPFCPAALQHRQSWATGSGSSPDEGLGTVITLAGSGGQADRRLLPTPGYRSAPPMKTTR